MKNAIRVLTLIAFTGSALLASASPSFAAHRPHPVAVAHKASVMKHKKGSKKVLINLERKKGRKGRKPAKKNRASEPAINQA